MFALFTPVMLVHFAVDNIPDLQAQGVQTIIGSSVMLWDSTKHGIRGRPRGKFIAVDHTPLNVG